MKRALESVLMLIFMCAASLAAQGGGPLPKMSPSGAPMRLEEFEALALQHNPTLRQASDLVERSAAEARQAGLYPNPTIGYEGSEIRGGSFGGGEQGAFIQQNIVLGGKLGRRKEVFQDQQREAEAASAEQRRRVLSGVDESFYAALSAQEVVKLRANLLKIAQDAVRTAHQLANVGQADTPDVLQAEVEAEQAQVDYATAQSNYTQAFEALAATAGAPDLPVSPLEGQLAEWPRIDASQVMALILRDSPSVKRAQEAVTAAEAQVRSAKRESVPDLRLRAGVQQDGEALDPTVVNSRAAGIVSFASVGIDIPIFNRNQGNVAAARADLKRSREELARVRLVLRRNTAPLLQNYLAEENQASQYRHEIIPKAARAYQLYLAKYRQMASAYPQVLVSQRTLFQLELAYARTLGRLWANAIALRNFTLTGGLQPPAAASGPPAANLNLP
ncbi:MAG: TolC family protein [Terriglobia bacterium]